ncbi:MAG: type I restriction-modification enzyme R subunit C-terminal domain-containing protein, partial [Bryobacteraceae bacterium]
VANRNHRRPQPAAQTQTRDPVGISLLRAKNGLDNGVHSTDPFDLLCNVAFNAPLRTRRERAEALRADKKNFFDKYSPEAHAVLDEMLDKYIDFGTAQFQIPDILKVEPISRRGNVMEIARLFGGAAQMRSAVAELQTLLYTA